METKNEIWKDIKGFEGRYQVSNLGRVWSLISNKELKPSTYQGYKANNLEWVTHAKNVVHATFTPRRMKTLHKTGRIKNIVQKDINGHFIAKFKSIKEASIKTGVPYMTIRNILKRGVKWRKDYIWEFAD